MDEHHISTNKIDELFQFSHPCCVSICVPVDPLAPDPQQNKIAFKNLVTSVQPLVQEKDAQTSETFDAFVKELLEQEVFWKEQRNTFVLLVAGKRAEYYKLATQTDESTYMISDHFYLVPFIRELYHHSEYFILELDKDNTKMWRADSRNLTQTAVPNLPTSIEEVTGQEMSGRGLQFHTGSDAPGTGKRPAIYHGSTSWKDDKDKYLERFLKAVDTAVVNFLKDSNYPLILLGVEELVVMYQKITQYKHIVEETLPKFVHETHWEKQLLEASSKIFTKRRQEEREEKITRIEETAPQLKVNVFHEVLRQAVQGKIQSLFVAQNTRVWGTFVPETMTAVVQDQQQPYSSELINIAIITVVQNGGEVFFLPAVHMPEEGEMIALLRY